MKKNSLVSSHLNNEDQVVEIIGSNIKYIYKNYPFTVNVMGVEKRKKIEKNRGKKAIYELLLIIVVSYGKESWVISKSQEKFEIFESQIETLWNETSKTQLPRMKEVFKQDNNGIKRGINSFLKSLVQNKEILEKSNKIHFFLGTNINSPEYFYKGEVSYLSANIIEGEAAMKEDKKGAKEKQVWITLRNRFLFLHQSKDKINPFKIVPISGSIVSLREEKNQFLFISSLNNQFSNVQEKILFKPSDNNAAKWVELIQEVNLQFSKNFKKVEGSLSVAIIEAKNLRGKDKNGLSCPFVTLFIEKQQFQSSVYLNSLNPCWDNPNFSQGTNQKSKKKEAVLSDISTANIALNQEAVKMFLGKKKKTFSSFFFLSSNNSFSEMQMDEEEDTKKEGKPLISNETNQDNESDLQFYTLYEFPFFSNIKN